ncbi:MAG TPA: DUF1801 domain-containing protein [Chitinophagaceae bacterium]
MAKIKTVKTDADVMEFINSVPDERRRKDSLKLLEVIEEVTGFEPYMYGPSIIGFGNYHYKYESGHEGDAPLAGFSPRKAAISLYFANYPGRDKLLKQFGKHKAAVACIYIKSLDDINIEVFKEMTKASMKHMQKLYPEV